MSDSIQARDAIPGTDYVTNGREKVTAGELYSDGGVQYRRVVNHLGTHVDLPLTYPLHPVPENADRVADLVGKPESELRPLLSTLTDDELEDLCDEDGRTWVLDAVAQMQSDHAPPPVVADAGVGSATAPPSEVAQATRPVVVAASCFMHGDYNIDSGCQGCVEMRDSGADAAAPQAAPDVVETDEIADADAGTDTDTDTEGDHTPDPWANARTSDARMAVVKACATVAEVESLRPTEATPPLQSAVVREYDRHIAALGRVADAVESGTDAAKLKRLRAMLEQSRTKGRPGVMAAVRAAVEVLDPAPVQVDPGPIIRDRVAEVLREGEWVRVPFMSIKSGDVFRLFESYGAEVHGGQAATATSDAYEEGGRGIIDSTPFTPQPPMDVVPPISQAPESPPAEATHECATIGCDGSGTHCDDDGSPLSGGPTFCPTHGGFKGDECPVCKWTLQRDGESIALGELMDAPMDGSGVTASPSLSVDAPSLSDQIEGVSLARALEIVAEQDSPEELAAAHVEIPMTADGLSVMRAIERRWETVSGCQWESIAAECVTTAQPAPAPPARADINAPELSAPTRDAMDSVQPAQAGDPTAAQRLSIKAQALKGLQAYLQQWPVQALAAQTLGLSMSITLKNEPPSDIG